ncbi:MAG: DUF362 domain-containing protein [Planctomycetaceae bacterium]|nr:DUF362 domain-containing protein [Planctomycetaceae bacterium]MBV8315479.1 DUF362 domain-containing protein [Planctomycetaceae bacterium]MBV8383904.1 DUF362 domain-containing protein [Planctomycetaceae bacterium]MBV8676322.1 DUF362 domain-containing protein [Planctomycetaceae bacterium]
MADHSPRTTPESSLAVSDAMPPTGGRQIGRREFLVSTGLGLAGGAGYTLLRHSEEGFLRADVLIAKADSYDIDLVRVVRDGLTELGLGRAWVKGKSVLLKPNLVEPSREATSINTHPALVRAVADVFRGWDAREVFVAEGQGHCRDSDYVLDQSLLGPILEEDGIEYVDLNHDEVFAAPNRMGRTRLGHLWLPRALRRADVIVSLPKMKTHHWAGVTLSMKNLFGVLPGICYGWPKNVLHLEGIPASILDINATVRPHLAIVDGIIGMEGDGPIMGTPRHAGVLVMGTNLPAVDATTARLMGIDPWRIPYLAGASGRLGPVAERHVAQRGEPLGGLVQPFAMVDSPTYRDLRGSYPSSRDRRA